MKPLSPIQARLLSELRIKTEVLLGTIELSAEEILDLTEETLIQIPLAEGQKVTLRAGGELIAIGRLVCDETQTFIEILQAGEDLQETDSLQGSIYRPSATGSESKQEEQ